MIDITGDKYGRLTVIRWDHTDSKGCTFWLCECECKNTKVLRSSCIRQGLIKSCGCLHKEVAGKRFKEMLTKHNESKTRLYRKFCGMRSRCKINSNIEKNKRDYSGRGITVCEEWKDYEVFRDWALSNGYSHGLSLDRIDVNGNYEPSNCRWITMKEQAGNKVKTPYVTYEGEKRTLKEWSKLTGIKYHTLYRRYSLSDDPEYILRKLDVSA